MNNNIITKPNLTVLRGYLVVFTTLVVGLVRLLIVNPFEWDSEVLLPLGLLTIVSIALLISLLEIKRSVSKEIAFVKSKGLVLKHRDPGQAENPVRVKKNYLYSFLLVDSAGVEFEQDKEQVLKMYKVKE